jgi:hypothetical protein
MDAVAMRGQATYNATMNTAVSFYMDYISSPYVRPSAILTVSSPSMVAQPLPVDMLFSSASVKAPNPFVLTVNPSTPCAALSAASSFSLSTVGSAVSFTVAASDRFGNDVAAWPDDALLAIHTKVTVQIAFRSQSYNVRRFAS